MKKLTGFIILLIVAFTMSGCSDNSPRAVAEKALSYMQKENWEGYVDLMYITDKENKNNDKNKKEFVELLKDKGGKVIEKKGGIKSYEILSEEISEDGNTAIVKTKIVYGKDGLEENENIKLKKDDNGNWKIDLGK